MMQDIKAKWEIEAEELRRRHQERLDARERELRFNGFYRSGDAKPPISKLIGNSKPKDENEEDDQ